MAMPGRSWAADSGYRFGFNGKEKMLGLNGLDFGARVNDVRLGRWLSVDPLAGKYPGLSPYAYVANNPIMFIDPNGEDIKIKRIIGKDGNPDVVVVTLNAVLVDYSTTVRDCDELQCHADRIAQAFEQALTGEGQDATGRMVIYRAEAKIRAVSSSEEIGEGEHVLAIFNKGKIPEVEGIESRRGQGYPGTLYVGLSEDGLSLDLGSNEEMRKLGKTDEGKHTFQKVAVHELIHTARIPHPANLNLPENIMHEAGNPNSGMKLDANQISKMERAYNRGNLNTDTKPKRWPE
jgi:RHS repeat-associated protein